MSNRAAHSNPRIRAPNPLVRCVPAHSCEDTWRDTGRGHVCVSRRCSLRTVVVPRLYRKRPKAMETGHYSPASARTPLQGAKVRADRTGTSSMPYNPAEKVPAILTGAAVNGDFCFGYRPMTFSRIRTPRIRSSRSITSGGRMRSVCSPAVSASRPSSHPRLTISFADSTTSSPQM